MSNSKYHISAFTMMDIMTGMVVMSLIVGIVFYLITAVNQQNYAYQNVRLELNELLLMESVVEREIDQCHEIYKLPNGFVLQGLEDIHYIQSGSALIRQTELSSDTIYKNITSITYGVADQSISAEPLIEQLTINLKLHEQDFNADFFKDYGIADQINYTLLHEL